MPVSGCLHQSLLAPRPRLAMSIFFWCGFNSGSRWDLHKSQENSVFKWKPHRPRHLKRKTHGSHIKIRMEKPVNKKTAAPPRREMRTFVGAPTCAPEREREREEEETRSYGQKGKTGIGRNPHSARQVAGSGASELAPFPFPRFRGSRTCRRPPRTPRLRHARRPVRRDNALACSVRRHR